MMHQLLTLGKVFDRREWVETARRAAAAMRTAFRDHPATYSHWGSLMARLAFETHEFVVAGATAFDDYAAVERQCRQRALVVHLSQPDDEIPLLAYRFRPETTLYACDENGCLPPITKDVVSAAQKIVVP
jgi:uncharacterized protein YyaL (SSP411 family)